MKEFDIKLDEEMLRKHLEEEMYNQEFILKNNKYQKLKNQKIKGKLKGKDFEFFFDENGSNDNPIIYKNNQHNDFVFERKSNKVSDHLIHHLLKDQLIDTEEKTKIELSSKFLKIDGDKQPKNIWKKYKKIYEEFTGLEMTKGSKLKFELDPSNRSKNGFMFFN